MIQSTNNEFSSPPEITNTRLVTFPLTFINILLVSGKHRETRNNALILKLKRSAQHRRLPRATSPTAIAQPTTLSPNRTLTSHYTHSFTPSPVSYTIVFSHFHTLKFSRRSLFLAPSTLTLGKIAPHQASALGSVFSRPAPCYQYPTLKKGKKYPPESILPRFPTYKKGAVLEKPLLHPFFHSGAAGP